MTDLRGQLEAAVLKAGPIYDLEVTLDELEGIVREAQAEVLRLALLEDRTTVSKLSPVEQLTCFLVKGEDLVVRAARLRGEGL